MSFVLQENDSVSDFLVWNNAKKGRKFKPEFLPFKIYFFRRLFSVFNRLGKVILNLHHVY